MQLFCDTRQYPPSLSLSETKAQKSFTLCQVQLSHNPPTPTSGQPASGSREKWAKMTPKFSDIDIILDQWS